MRLKFILIFLSVHLLILEIFSWSINYYFCVSEPALLHPQLAWDLLSATIFYLGFGVGWLILFSRYHFRLREMFLVQGIAGILLEQQGKLILTFFRNIPATFLILISVFAVYGGTALLAGYLYAKLGGKLGSQHKKVNPYIKILISILVLLFGAILFSLLLNLIQNQYRLLPERHPICERPFL